MTNLTVKNKEQLHKLIFERAYEIEEYLSEDNFFIAKLCGLKPEQVGDAALKVAVKELQKEFNK